MVAGFLIILFISYSRQTSEVIFQTCLLFLQLIQRTVLENYQ